MSKRAPVTGAGQKNIYRRLLAYIRPYRVRFFSAVLAMCVFGATDGAVPYLLKRVLDDVFGNQDRDMLTLLVSILLVFAIVRGVFGFLERFLTASVGHAIVRDVRNELMEKLLSLPSAFYERNASGNLIARITNDTLLIRTALTDAAAAVLRDTVRVIALLCVAFYLDPTLALIAFLGFPIGILPVVKFAKRVRKLSKVGQDQFGGMTSLLHELITGHKVVQAFTREPKELERFKGENQNFTDVLLKAEKYGALSGPTNEVVGSVAVALVILYGGLSVISGVRTQGDFIAFITAMFLLYEPIKKMSRVQATIQGAVAAAERIFEVLDTPSEIQELSDAKVLEVNTPRIEFANVSFSYYPEDSTRSNKLALSDTSLVIEPGTTVALVGMSGGGKTTLVNLLPRFYDPQQGTIRIDGVDIRSVTLRSLRESMSIVSQHTFLFNDTVLHNIAYGKQEATREEVVSAAQAANAHQFIQALPEGYDTIIGEQGLTLSGGQRARLAIARALLRNAPILILDEATASLDSESEGLVQDAIDKLMQGRTVLVIAHRLATVRSADQIFVLVNGQIVERGRHTELLERGGEYAKLYRMQFKDTDAEGKGAEDEATRRVVSL